MLKTSPFNSGSAGSILGQEAKIPHASQPKNKNIKQKLYRNKFNKDFKNGSHFLKRTWFCYYNTFRIIYNILFTRYIHEVEGIIIIISYGWITLHDMNISRFVFPFFSWWIFHCFFFLTIMNNRFLWTFMCKFSFHVDIHFQFSCVTLWSEISGTYGLTFWGTAKKLSKELCHLHSY